MTTKYWVGGGSSTNWNATANTNWALTSGGANNAAVPTTGDAVIFDANSGTGTSVLNVAESLIALDCLGYTGTLSHSSAITLTITGNDAGAPNSVTFRLPSGMTYTKGNTSTSAVTFTSTSGTSTINTSKNMGSLTLNGVGGTFTLGANLQLGATSNDGCTLTLTNGTFNANNFNVLMDVFSSNNSNTRTITMGSGTWTIMGSGGTLWDFGTVTGLTFNCNTSTLAFNVNNSGAAGNNTKTFVTGGQTYNTVSVAADNGQYSFSLTGSGSTIATLNFSSPGNFNFGNGCTITNPINWNGSGYTSAFIISGNVNTITLSNPGSTINWGVLRGFTSGTNTVTATNSINAGANSNVTITGPSGGGGTGVVGS